MQTLYESTLKLALGKFQEDVQLRCKYALLLDSPVDIALIEVGRRMSYPSGDTWEPWPVAKIPGEIVALLTRAAREHARLFVVQTEVEAD